MYRRSWSVSGDAKLIKEQAGRQSENLTYLEVTLEKTVGTSSETMTETGSLVTLVVPYDFSGKRDVTVYRVHDGAAEKLTEGSGEGSYKLDTALGLVYIYTQKFSVYAIGYTVPSTPGGDSGGYTPSADKSKLNAAIAAAEALKEEDYTAGSWTALETALAAARTVAANGSASQAQVDAALNALTTARNTLVKKGEEQKPGPGEDEPGPGEEIKPPAGGTGWRWVESEQTYYYFKDGKRVGDYWVGFADGASAWPNNWYYADANGRLLTGFQYLDDLKGGKAWYMLQTTNTNGTMGKMLTGWQWTYDAAGTGYFSPKYGSQGACTYTTAWGSYSAATGLWAGGPAHKR